MLVYTLSKVDIVSWNQLLSIINANKDEQDQRRTQPPSACPVDGMPLVAGPNNILFCPMGNYRWDGGESPYGS